MTNKVQVDIVGLSASPSAGGAHVLLLKETFGKRRLPIIIGYPEAASISNEIDGAKPPRPMTHDLMKTIIDYLSATVTEVVIDDIRENTFYAKLVLEVASLEHFIDARPSDAIAIGLRFGAPIYVTEEVLNRAGFEPSGEAEDEEPDFPEMKKVNEQKSKSSQTKLGLLQDQLREALEKEDYERAAKLRDEIKKILGNAN
ncbi:MAG: bifunctional nuclease family protein [Ignavibacteriales bacterium]